MYNIMKAFEGNHIFGEETLLKDDEWPLYSTKKCLKNLSSKIRFIYFLDYTNPVSIINFVG